MITQEWEKISTDYVSGKGLVSRIYKNSYNSTVKNNPIKKRQDLCRPVSKDKHVASWCIKRCLISLVIGEMQMKTTVRSYCPPTRMTNGTAASVGKNEEKVELLYVVCGTVKAATLKYRLAVPQSGQQNWSCNSLPVVDPDEVKT